MTGVIALLGVWTEARAQPLGTAFTYQGRLLLDGQPYTGDADLVFDLFTTETGGASMGTVTLLGQAVSDGSFNALLDFGPAPFGTPNDLWLEVAANGVMLSPRQRVTPAPFSLATRGISVDAAGRVGIGTASPTDRLELSGGSVVLSGTGGSGRLIFKSTAGTGHQFEWYPDYAAVGSLSLFDRTTGASPLTVSASGSFGVGTTAPTARLDVAGGARVSGDLVVGGTITTAAVARSVSVNASAFVAQDSFYQYDRLPAGQPGLAGTSPGNTMRFYANVSLPDGATITGLSLKCLDVIGRSISLSLIVVPTDPANAATLASVTSVPGGAWQSFSAPVANVVVNNRDASYMLFATWVVPGNYTHSRLGSAQVHYTATSVGP